MKFIVFLFIFYFQFFSDDVYIVYSDIQSPLDNLVVTARHQHLVFSLDACKEAYIFLTSHPEDLLQNSYQILIGTSENKQSSIRKMAPFEDIRNFDTDNILSCGNTQTMWISWSAGNISVGIGVDVGENVKFTWIDNQPYSINGFALASADDNPVKWMFPRGYGIAFLLLFFIFLNGLQRYTINSTKESKSLFFIFLNGLQRYTINSTKESKSLFFIFLNGLQRYTINSTKESK